jgi:hypothetical protein
MRNRSYTLLFALTAAVAWIAPARSEDRSMVLLFGPTGADHAQQAAHSVAATALNWLKLPGATAEIRRPGVADSQELSKFMQPKDIEQALLDAAKSSRDIDLMSFINALDKSTYASARRSGRRVLVVILDSPPPTVEAVNRLKQTVEFCRSNAVRVMVIDPSGADSRDSGGTWKSLASSTGGVWNGAPKELDASLLVVAPVEKAGSEIDAPRPVAPAAANPVHARFIRTREQYTGSGMASDLGPAHGWLVVESPFSSLQFEQNDTAGTYQARARVTAMVKSADGKVAWQAKKEVTLKGPLRKLAERRAGNLYFLREVRLAGGKYTLEALVEDLISNKSWTCSEPLKSGVNLPGFAVSGAMFVRTLNESADRFESDQVLSHEGRALAPLLDPSFRANVEFELDLYFIVYPDLRGGQPDMSLEILHDGQVVGRTQLPFNDKIRDTTRESQDVGSAAYGAGHGEQKGQFPYLATIRDASFSAGEYEARLTVRQDRQTITRSVPFRVVR